MPLLLVMWSLSFGATSSSFRVLPLLKWTSMPYFFPMFFIVSLRPSSYGTVMWPLFFVLDVLLPSLGIYMLSGPSVCVHLSSTSSNFLIGPDVGYLPCCQEPVLYDAVFALLPWQLILLEQMFFALWLIKESMFIRVNNPSLNKNIGKYHLPHVWDEVLINNIELKLK